MLTCHPFVTREEAGTPAIPREYEFTITEKTTQANASEQNLQVLSEDLAFDSSASASAASASASISSASASASSTASSAFQTPAAVDPSSQSSATISKGDMKPPMPISSLSLLGRIVRRCECRPVPSPEYFNMKRAHLQAAHNPQRTAQTTDVKLQPFKPIDMHPADVHILLSSDPLYFSYTILYNVHHNMCALSPEQVEHEIRKKEEGRRIRAEPEEVRQKLFAAFEKHQYYNIKDLADVTGQPVVHTSYLYLFFFLFLEYILYTS